MKEFLLVDVDGNYTISYIDGSGITRVCDAGAAVGDLVVDSETVANGVDVLADNVDVRSGVSGIIVEKLDTTKCIVASKAVIEGLSGLTKGAKVFLSTTGGMTPTRPTTGYFCILGHAVEVDTLNFNPINTVVAMPEGYDTQAEAEANPIDLDVGSLTVDGSSLETSFLLG